MTLSEQYIHDVTGTAVAALIVAAALAVTGWFLVTVVAPRLERRRRLEARDRRWEAFRKQSDETVPMLTQDGGR